jgi:hypothetical protein
MSRARRVYCLPVAWRGITRTIAASLACAVTGLCLTGAPGALAATQPVEMAAPYEYLGWGDPQPPTSVMAASGVHGPRVDQAAEGLEQDLLSA